MMHSAARFPTPVMVSSRSRAALKGAITRSTSASSCGDHGLEVLEVLQRQPHQQGVVVLEPAVEGLAQRGQLLAQSAFGQLGEDVGIPSRRPPAP